MKKSLSLWRTLDRLSGLSTTLPQWRTVLGGYFQAFMPYLRVTSRKALGIPCPTECDAACRRRVVEHGQDDIAGVCPEGNRSIPLSRQDIVIYELHVRKICDRLADVLHVEPGLEEIPGFPMAWRLGVFAATPANRIPVFLSLHNDPSDMHNLTVQILLESSHPILLLGMTRAVCSPRTGSLLRPRNSRFLALEELVEFNEDMTASLMLKLKACIPGFPGDSETYPPDAIVIDRVACEDGVHWVVNGEDKGVLFKRRESIRARIIEILFEQIGIGWIPHETFQHACAWSPQRYFANSNNPSIIQKHLTEIRNFLNVEILFRKDHGVRFAEKVVKSRK